MKRINKKWIGYILYSLILTAVLLYCRFPSDAAKDYLLSRIEDSDMGVSLAAESLNFSFPLCLEFFKPDFFLKKNPDAAFLRAEQLIVKPGIWSFLNGRAECFFECVLSGGNVKGSVQFSKRNLPSPFSASIDLSGIHMDNYSCLPIMVDRNINGVLEGSLTYSGLSDALLDGTGEMRLKLSNGRVNFPRPVLNMKEAEFDELSIKLALKNKTINLSRLELKGGKIQGTLSGTVLLKREILKSRLKLQGLAGSFDHPITKNGLPFSIHGTFERPEIKFIQQF